MLKIFLRENPKISKEIENKILENAGIVEKAMMEGDVPSKEKIKIYMSKRKIVIFLSFN